MNKKIDKTDRKILAQLTDNSKVMSKALSRKLKIHPNTLLQRLKKLEKSGVIIKYTTVVEYNKVSPAMPVLIALSIDMVNGWEDQLKPLSRFPEVVSFFLTTGGEYDALALVRVKNENSLAVLLRKMQANKVVTKTTSHIILDSYKNSHDYNPFKDEFRC